MAKTKSKKLRIAIDFDGTIVTHDYPGIGSPVPGAIEWLKKWKEAGATLILWTMRSDSAGPVLTDAVNWLAEQGIVLDGVNAGPGDRGWTTSPKAYANVYVDDAAYGCPLVHDVHARPYVDWALVGPGVLGLIQARCDV
jgi:hypothetical protein